jgi:hypothetical protein
LFNLKKQKQNKTKLIELNILEKQTLLTRAILALGLMLMLLDINTQIALH